MLKSDYFIEDVHSIYTSGDTKAFQGFEIKNKLFSKKSPFQKIEIFDNDSLGKILVLDGIVQITEKDEFIYQEMMAHVPIFSHSKPTKVLIIGGGDGGILREVLQHHSLTKVVMVEIDQDVINACIEYIPSINNSGAVFEDSRVELKICDASNYVKETDEKFDIIIIDSTDPIGPGEKLFTKEFYKNLTGIMNEDAIVVTQGGVPLFQPGEVKTTLKHLSEANLQTSVYLAPVPTYYGGSMTLGYACFSPKLKLASLSEIVTKYNKSKVNTKHYNPEVHIASFVLPKWIQDDVSINK